MGEQLEQVDFAQAATGELGNHFPHLHRQMQVSAFDAIQHQRIGELFAHRERHKRRLFGERAAGGAVGVAEREIQHDLAASRHPQGGAVVATSVDIGVDAGCHPREAERVETLNFSVLGNHVRAPLAQILRSP